ILRKPGFRMVRFRVETIPVDGELDIEEEKSFLQSAADYFRSAGADLILPATNNAIFQTFPQGAKAAPYGTFIKYLAQPEEAMWNEVHSDYRQNIRKAIKTGVQIRSGAQYLEPAYHLIADTLKRSNMKFRQFDEFKRIIESLGDNVKIYVAEHQGKMH